MALKVNSDIALTGSLTVSGSYGLAAADIPSLAADKITSGTFAAARIPSLAASKITSGTFADARIASAANWNTAYNWGNHAAAGYSTFDGAYDSLTGRPTIPTNNNQLTNGAGYLTSVPSSFTSTNVTVSGYIKGNGQQLVLNAGESHSYATGQTGEYIYLNAEQGLEINSETGNWSGGWAARKTAYLRGDQLTLDSETLTKTNIQNFKTAYSWGNHASAGYSTSDTNYYLNGITKSGNTLTFSVNGTTNQTYTFGSLAFSSATYDNYGSWNLKTGGTQRTTVGSGGTLDIVGGTNVSVAYGAGGIVTISSTDTNTTYSVGDGGLTQKNFTTTLKNKLDGIATSADAYGGWNISDGTNSEKIQANNTLTVQGGGAASVSYDSGNNTLTISATDTNTTYSTATSSTLGLVKIGYTENGKNYPVELSSGKMFVNVPWTDTNTDTDTITRVGVSGSEASGVITLAASGAASISQSGSTITISATDTNTQLSDAQVRSKISGTGLISYNSSTGVISTTANNYSLPAGSSTIRGGFKIGYTENGKNYPVEVSSEQMYVNVPWTDTNTTYSNATTSTAGLMSTTDKSKLDGIAASANNYSLPAGSSTVRGGFKIGYTENGKNYPVEVSSEKMYVNVPWTDTNTNTITSVGVSGSETTGTVTLAASGAASISQVGSTVTISATNTTYSEYSGSSAGLVPSGSGGTGKFLQEDGTWAIPVDNNTTYSAGAGLTLSGTTFAVDSNLAGDVFTIGRDGNDKYTVNTTNHAWYLDGVLDMRLNNDGNLDVDGDVIAYSTVTSSDRKLKTDIKTLKNASEKVRALRGVSFTWDHGRKTGKKDIGLIAQEVEEVVPEIVGEAELLDGTMAKHVDYPKLVALLIESNKELMARVETLEAKLNGITE